MNLVVSYGEQAHPRVVSMQIQAAYAQAAHYTTHLGLRYKSVG